MYKKYLFVNACCTILFYILTFREGTYFLFFFSKLKSKINLNLIIILVIDQHNNTYSFL